MTIQDDHDVVFPASNEDTRIAPVERGMQFRDVVAATVNEAQFAVLTGKTPKWAIRYKPKGGKQMPYVPHGYIRDVLNKAFGFDWDFRVLTAFDGKPYDLREQDEGRKTINVLTVLGELTVRVHNPVEPTDIIASIVKQEFGSQIWRSEMEFGDALKGASSDALKRCGVSMGIALDLYYNDDAAKLAWELAEKERFEAEQKLQRLAEMQMRVRELSNTGKTPREVAEQLGISVAEVVACL